MIKLGVDQGDTSAYYICDEIDMLVHSYNL